MKEVMAMIRINKMNQTKTALADNGISAMTAWPVMGRGKGNVDPLLLAGAGAGYEEAISRLGPGPRFFPKRMLSIVVPDEKVKTVIDVIVQVNQTGNPGDGKIFVVPCLEAVRVRTNERDDEALSELPLRITTSAASKESAA